MEKKEKSGFAEVLEVASQAGHILLENGAEISRVEETMERIASHFGVDSRNFFVLSNGIFTTGSSGKFEKTASSYANVEFIPIRSIQLSKVSAVNSLSFDIAAGKCSLEEARARLNAIRSAPAKPAWEQILGSAFGSAGFCAVFGGGWTDCAAAFVAGLLLYSFILGFSAKHLSKIVGGICNALIVTLLCIISYRIGFGSSLSNIIIGAIMPLIPGVPFVNGVRDLANSDYIAGITRLTDAMLGFFCIAMGVSLAFMLDGAVFKGVIDLGGVLVNAGTSGIGWQALAAFIGTAAFAVLFGADNGHIWIAGGIGAVGWTGYLLLVRLAAFTAPVATLLAALLVCILSRMAAVPMKCPATVFLLCGIFPLVPGAGIFWCTYYMVSGNLPLSLSSGFLAIKIAVAIVLGIVLAMELPQRMFSHRRSATAPAR